MAKPRRKQKDYELDIERYNQLIQQDLEIPPKRNKGRKRTLIKQETEETEEIEEIEETEVIPRRTRSATRRVKLEPQETAKPRKRKVIKKSIAISKRPSYKPEHKPPIELKSNIKTIQSNLPPKITDNISTFEQKIRLDYTYPELIKLIKANIKQSIDISLHHNFIPKNIDQETNRFNIPDEFYSPNYKTSLERTFVSDLEFFLHQWNSSNEKPNISLV